MLYKAFISYSHTADQRLAAALQSALQQFAKPYYAVRAFNVFRDQTDLSANPSLWPKIESALDSSEYFLLLASPESAKSYWVKRELDHWLRRHHGKPSNLILLLTGGQISWNMLQREFDWSTTTALPQALDWEPDHHDPTTISGIFTDQPFHVDLRWAKGRTDFSLRDPKFLDNIGTIAAELHGQPKSALVGRDVAEHKRFRKVRASAIIGLAVLAIVATIFGISAYIDRNKAESALSDYDRLADLKLIDDYTTSADALWPARPEKIPTMREWLKNAIPLTQRLPGDIEALDRAKPKSNDTNASLFDTHQTRWKYDNLHLLVQRLEDFNNPDWHVGTVASVKARLAAAETVTKDTIDDYKGQWHEAIKSISDRDECPMYNGLAMTPQLGLVPIGRDPASRLWEFAVYGLGDIPIRNQAGVLVISEQTTMVLVLIPGGSFFMGAEKPTRGTSSPNEDRFAYAEEAPVHKVTLAPFFISKYEMTQGQWLRFTGSNPSTYKPGDKRFSVSLRHPVENISWTESRKTLLELGLELPTEAQTEYATRAGTNTIWWTGNNRGSLRGAANIADESAIRAGENWPDALDWKGFDDGFPIHSPVGSFRANPFGLYDVHGNVWEWCLDFYGLYSSPLRDGSDGLRLPSDETAHVDRNGDFMSKVAYARSAFRDKLSADYRYFNLGVRPARTIER